MQLSWSIQFKIILMKMNVNSSETWSAGLDGKTKQKSVALIFPELQLIAFPSGANEIISELVGGESRFGKKQNVTIIKRKMKDSRSAVHAETTSFRHRNNNNKLTGSPLTFFLWRGERWGQRESFFNDSQSR